MDGMKIDILFSIPYVHFQIVLIQRNWVMPAVMPAPLLSSPSVPFFKGNVGHTVNTEHHTSLKGRGFRVSLN
jgi:hypothetical protein